MHKYRLNTFNHQRSSCSARSRVKGIFPLAEYRDEVTHYLVQGVSETAVAETKTAQQFIDPKVNQLIPIVQGYKSQGQTNDQILSFLIKGGWPEDIIRKAIEMAK